MKENNDPPILGEILISSYDQLAHILSHNPKVFLRFYDTNCKLCKQLGSRFQTCIDNNRNIVFCSVFCSMTPEIAEAMKANFVPYFVAYSNGVPFAAFTGSDFNTVFKMVEDLAKA